MDQNSRENLWRILKVVLFLFCSIVFILPYIVQISTYFHEKAHQQILSKYDVDNDYNFDPIMTIPNFFNSNMEALGMTNFSFSSYEQMDKYQRVDLHVAGIVSDLKIIFLMSLYLCIINLYLFYKLKIRNYDHLGIILGINWVIFMWLLYLIPVTIANITYPSGDINQLVRFLKV